MKQRIEYRVFPIDTQGSTAVGISLPFNKKGIFGLNYTTQDQVKTNLTNFMLTNAGERVYNVDYGADLGGLLWEPQGNTDEINARIMDRIKAYFPQITVSSLNFSKDEDRGYLFVTLKYSFNRVEDSLIIGLQLQ